MMIDGRKLGLIYDAESEAVTHALRDISISIGPKGITGITGPSGSGKSSLLYILSGLKPPTYGTVFYDDVDTASYTPLEKAAIRRARFGFVFQRHFLIDYLTVLDNVLSAVNLKDEACKMKALGLLDRLRIGGLSGKKPYQLSCGQRQRAAIARALVNSPQVVFADEPTASLDQSSAREVMEVLLDYSQMASVVIVTHDRSLLKSAGRVIRLWDGHMLP